MKLDLSNFKKVSSDDKVTVLEHPNKHQIRISHKGLSPEHRKELDEMPTSLAKGGRYGKFAQQNDPNIQQKGYKHPPGKGVGREAARSSGPSEPSRPSGDPGYTEPKDMGTPKPPQLKNSAVNDSLAISLNQHEAMQEGMGGANKYGLPCLNPSCKSYGRGHPNCLCYGGNEHAEEKFSSGGEVADKEYFCDNNRSHFKGCEYYKDGGEVSDSDKLAQAAQDVESMDPESKMTSQEPAQSSPQPMPGTTPDPYASQQASAPQAQPSLLPSPDAQEMNPNPEMGSNDQPSQAMPSEQPAAESQQPSSPMQTFQQHKQNASQELFPEAQAFKQDLDNGHITPETYQSLFAKKDTLPKIGTIFGLLLSGMGAGLTHGPNMLLEMMNKQISNDLEAQQNSQLNKQNYLKINQQNVMTQAQAKNLNVEAQTKAFALSKVQMNMAALHKLVSDAQKLPDGPQKQQAMQTLAMMNQGVQNENFNILDRAATAAALGKTLAGEPSGGNTTLMKSGLLGPEAKEVGEDRESKQVPGFPGMATAPLGAGEKGELRSGAVFDSAMNDLINWTKAHPNGAIKGSPEDQRGRALAGIVQGKFREATNGGVYKSGEQDFINKLVPEDPTKIFNSYRVLPKLQAVQKEMSSQTDAKAKSYGLQGYSGMKQQPQQQAQNLQSKSGREIYHKNGKAYYR